MIQTNCKHFYSFLLAPHALELAPHATVRVLLPAQAAAARRPRGADGHATAAVSHEQGQAVLRPLLEAYSATGLAGAWGAKKRGPLLGRGAAKFRGR